jgi:hypothetical protein
VELGFVGQMDLALDGEGRGEQDARTACLGIRISLPDSVGPFVWTNSTSASWTCATAGPATTRRDPTSMNVASNRIRCSASVR